MSGMRPSASVEIALVCMPWATTTRPSIALGILDRLCGEADVASASLFPNLDITARLGFDAARPMSDERALYGLGEHLFAVDMFGRDALDSDDFIEAMCRLDLPAPFSDMAFVQRLRDEVVPAFLDDTIARILALDAPVVGFTATFNQVMASLAAAARIKRVRPETLIIAGGACFDGEMGQEYHRALPDVLDHVFMGEAEESFREFLTRRKAGVSTDGIKGVTWHDGDRIQLTPGGGLEDMNSSPMPNYFPYFAEVERVRGNTGAVLEIEALPFEGSRGCWWGQKNHCLFCGINADLLRFREKSPERVLDEIMVLSHLHGVAKLTATDWIISRRSRIEIFEALRDSDFDIEIFYETRSDLDKSEVALMKAAGALRVQPGIESFSTPVLKLMRKGTTGLKQVRFLKWAREYGVRLSYNILCGFPGDEPDWYLEMADLITQIHHLQPPSGNATPIELHRFSPLFEHRQKFGIEAHVLRADYRFNFPDGMVDPLKIGYFFEFETNTICDPDLYMDRVRAAIQPWLAHWEARALPRCEYRIGPGYVLVEDQRFGDGQTLALRGIAQDAFLLLDDIMTRESLAQALTSKYPAEVASGMLDLVIDDLLEKKLLLQEGNLLLGLAVGNRPRSTEEIRDYVLDAADEPLAVAAE